MSKAHKKHGKCTRDFKETAKNDNAKKCPHPKLDVCVPKEPKEPKCCIPPKCSD